MKKYYLASILLALIIACVGLACLGGCKKKQPQSEQPEDKYYTVSYSAEEGGQISGDTLQTVKENGDAESVMAVPYRYYVFVAWSDGVNTAERMDRGITSDISVTATFAKLTYTLKYETDSNGYIDGQTTQTVKYGESGATVTAIPNTGYKFVKWSDDIETAERTDKNITADKTVTAVFEQITFTVRYETDGNGYIAGEAIQTVEYGKSATPIKAVPNTGYVFAEWSDGLTTSDRQDKNITADKIVKVIFEKIKFNVHYTANAGGTIYGNTEQEIKYAENGDFVVAVPDTGYKFVKWSDGNDSAVRRDLFVTATINVTAEFEFLFAGGTGTQLNPFTIANYTHLLNIWYYPDANYKLINDLNLVGISHEPIYDNINYFKGNFDGGGYTIENLNVETESNYPSLFGVIGGGSVSNLNLVGAKIKTTDYYTFDRQDKYYVGVLAGMLKGYIHDINVEGLITVNELSHAGVAIGGLVGFVNGTVANCVCNVQLNIKNVNSTSANYPFVFGGMLGVCDSAFIRDCNAEGQINITECYWTESGSAGDLSKCTEILAGGLIGYYFTDRQVSTYIRNSNANVKILGDNNYNAGGFVGYLNAGQDTSLQVVDCSVFGDVTCGIVGGFVYKAITSGVSTLLFEKCIIENNLTAFIYGAGFVYLCQSSSDGVLQIKNSYTIGNLKTCSNLDSERVVGRAAGFSWQMSNVSVINCFSKRDINSSDGRGFSFVISRSEVSSCFYEGTIDISNGAGTSRGVGMFDNFLDSTLVNCYVKVNFITGEKNTSDLYALIRGGHGKLNNFYCYGNYCKLFYSFNLQNVFNGHVFRATIEESNLPQEGDEADITFYDNKQDMYYLADKLNKDQGEVWVNVEKALPELKFELK